MLTRIGCHARQRRLLERMESAGCDLFLTSNYRTVYYLTGLLAPPETPVIFLLRADATSLLFSPVTAEAAVSEVIPIETYSIERAIERPFEDAARWLRAAMAGKPSRSTAAVERAATPALIENAVAAADGIIDASDMLLRLRKRKEPDEVDEIRASLRCCSAALETAREAIFPGRTEIDVFNAMQAAVNCEAGSSVALIGDFACGARCIDGGGPPTARKLKRGDLYILDIRPAPALYCGDVCRTFAVGEPNELQLETAGVVLGALRHAETLMRPGVRARDVYFAVKERLREVPAGANSFWHHAGHGIGHNGHEAPRLIPGSRDVLEPGDVIAVEPGVYAAELHGGIRLEDNYLVGPNGVENLFDFPMTL
jgi:Xaa-Pro aminopeptidase